MDRPEENNALVAPAENNTLVTVALGGKLWILKLGHKALKFFTTQTKIPMSRLNDALDRYDLLCELLYAMLWVQDHTVTHAQLDDWMEDADLMEVFNKVGQAAQAAFPQTDPESEQPEENPPEAAGTGEKA